MLQVWDLVKKALSIFNDIYAFFVNIMAVKQDVDEKKKFTYILHIRVETGEDSDFYIAKKITTESSLRIPDIVGITKNPISFKKSDASTFLASILVDVDEAPQLLEVLTHMGFFLDGTIKVSEQQNAK